MAQHPIGYVSRRTGLSTHVIRVWESRYQAVTPERTDTARRLYSEADIDRLKLLRSLSNSGLSIGQIAARPTPELKRLVLDLSLPTATAPSPPDIGRPQSEDLNAILRDCQSGIEQMDGDQLDAALMRSRVALSDHAVLEDLVGPLLTWLGDQWHQGKIRASAEHLATVVVKRFLVRMRESYELSPDAPSLVVSTTAGELHELGALLAATVAAIEGWKEFYFGPNLPATELANAVMQKRARILALSIAAPGDSPRLCAELVNLRRMVPDDTEIVVGGEGAARHREFLNENRIRLLDSLSAFRTLLSDSRKFHTNQAAD